MKRDDFHRCRFCKGIFRDDECVSDESGVLTCPNQCQPTSSQPPYESPLN